jgi:hypothetical protein
MHQTKRVRNFLTQPSSYIRAFLLCFLLLGSQLSVFAGFMASVNAAGYSHGNGIIHPATNSHAKVTVANSPARMTQKHIGKTKPDGISKKAHLAGTKKHAIIADTTPTVDATVTATATATEIATATATATATETAIATPTDVAAVENGTPTPTATATTAPRLTIANYHVGTATAYQPGDHVAYMLEVSNLAGAGDESKPISIVDTLPTGLTGIAASGSGWTANQTNTTSPATITLTYNGAYPVAAGTKLSPAVLSGVLTSDAGPAFTNTATAYSPDGFNPAINTGYDTIAVQKTPVAGAVSAADPGSDPNSSTTSSTSTSADPDPSKDSATDPNADPMQMRVQLQTRSQL